MNNPYTNRGAIKNPHEFYGREREIRRIYSRLSSSHPQCISIIGDRKIGKSSLLYFISHEDIRKQWLKDAESYLFLLIDLQEWTGEVSFSTFFQFLFKTLVAKFPTVAEFATSATEAECYETFKKIVSHIEKQGLKFILLFDEFGAIAGSAHFDPDFFSFLRSIANNHECAYITTSRLKLQKLCHNTDISESPFFNIFTPVPLGPFDRDEARALIFTPSKQVGVPFDERDAEFVLSVAGYHPLFIQMACAALFDHKIRADEAARKTDFELVKADFLVEATEQFEQIWQDADESEQQVLSQIARSGNLTGQQRYLVRELQRKGYLTDDNPPVPFSQVFAEFILAKPPDADFTPGPPPTYPPATGGTKRGEMPGQPTKRTSFLSRIRGLFKSGK
ncbi:ATP-binding protein [Candidatus Poribacteria bacterium]|nr:ATP-binding protein [Candidatus Poribacteria bacterium]